MKRFDRVWETTTTTGTDSYVLAGAKSAKYRAFGDPNVLEDGDYTEYFATDGTDWERGWGKYTTATTTLTRNVVESSTGSLIDWGSGTKDVFIAPPAASLNDERSIYVGTSRPAWLRANSPWFNSDTGALYWYDGSNDVPVTAVSGGNSVPYLGGAAYAEGSWTPALAGTTTPGTQTYSVQVGRYVRIGSLVTAWFYIALSAKDGTTAGELHITGLPFTASNVSGLRYPVSLDRIHSVDLSAGYTQFTAGVIANTATIRLNQTGDNVSTSALAAAAIGASSQICGAATYRTG